eukprot:3658090-Pyramimonas_sp.AAC.1
MGSQGGHLHATLQAFELANCCISSFRAWKRGLWAAALSSVARARMSRLRIATLWPRSLR